MSNRTKAAVHAVALVALLVATAAGAHAETLIDKVEYSYPLGSLFARANAYFQAKSPDIEMGKPSLTARYYMHITAYSSSEDETDSTPNITASGTQCRDGVVASNVFPIGTEVRIPEYFGDKVFVVEDRMHSRFTDRIDVWMPSKGDALLFGKRSAAVEIVEL